MFTDTQVHLGLLLFIAAALGWAAARLTAQYKIGYRKPLSSEYFRGLNFLLAEKPDKALEVFIKMVEVDSETVETHFALGSLFRRRGEVDRAIRVHQNLIARPNLKKEFRTQALFALGEDYMKAGLLDRAENLFLELSRDRGYQRDALNHLVAIYELQKDWGQAVSVFRQRESASGEYRGDVISHYFCELALTSKDAGDLKSAQRFARKALSFDRNSGRPNIITGDIAIANGKLREAVKHYRLALEKDVRLCLEVLPRMIRGWERLPDSGFDKIIGDITRGNQQAVGCVAVTAILHPELAGAAVDNAVNQFLSGSGQLRNLGKLLDEFGFRNDADQSYSRVKRSLRELARVESLYRCQQCGYSGSMLHWQCPSCRSWNTTHPHVDFSVSGSPDLPSHNY